MASILTNAELLITKELSNVHAIVGQPLTVRYFLYNSDKEESVSQVRLIDDTFMAPARNFTIIDPVPFPGFFDISQIQR